MSTFLKRANAKFGAVLQQPVNIGDTKLYINALPTIFPLYLVVDYGTGVEEIRVATSAGANFVNCDAAVNPHSVNATVQCLDVVGYINDLATLYEVDHNSDGSHQISNFGLSDYVITGITIPTSVNLNATSVSGSAFISGKKTSVASDSGHAYTASNDTYVDIDTTGTLHYTSVANSGTPGSTLAANTPALSAGYIRAAVVCSTGTAIPLVIQSGYDGLGNPIRRLSPKPGLLYAFQKDLQSWTSSASTSEQVIGGGTIGVISLPLIGHPCVVKIEFQYYWAPPTGNNNVRGRIGTSASYLTNTIYLENYSGGSYGNNASNFARSTQVIDLSNQNYVSFSIVNDAGNQVSFSGNVANMSRTSISVEIYDY